MLSVKADQKHNIMAAPVKMDWNSNLPIYASASFLKTVSDEYGWIGGVDDNGKLLCILPYSLIHKSVFRLIRFPVQTIFLEGELDIHREKVFLNSAVEYFRSIGSDLIIPATFNTIFRTYPDGAMVAPYGSYTLNLDQSEETLWNNLHQKHRNVIRNAMKKGVKIRTGIEYLEKAYFLVRDSFRRSAKGYMGKMRIGFRMDFDAFKQQVLSLGENVRVVIAEYEGVMQGCAVIPYSHHCAYYMHGGSIPNPLTGAMNLLQWEAIRLFRELGVRHYDLFGVRLDPKKGSKAEGIMKFKERFGGQLIRGYMWKFSFRPLKYFLYSIAVRVRSGGDVVDQECHTVNTILNDDNNANAPSAMFSALGRRISPTYLPDEPNISLNWQVH